MLGDNRIVVELGGKRIETLRDIPPGT